jgi:prophage antirepressor-like protein
MAMTMKSFNFGESKVFTIIDKDSNVWFKGFDVATILGYAKPRNAILMHVDSEDKRKRGDFSDRPISGRLEKNATNETMINESGLYALILRSKLESAKAFKRWITSEVLPTLRKTGQYKINNTAVKTKLTFKIENEYDLHAKTINFIRNFFPDAITTVCNLELSNDTSDKRIKCHELGYTPGTFDLIINNLHKQFSGYAIEFKSPTGKGSLSEAQAAMKLLYESNNIKTLVSNDYDAIISSIIEYMADTRVKCNMCQCKFKSTKTLKNHLKYFHKVSV